ncbi:hypothetical protein Bca101_045377 [Brassica carinata]
MVGEAHGQSQMAKQNQNLTALQEVDQIAQLRRRKKAKGQRPQPGERRFGDVPEAVYVEPKPPDPSRINQTPTSKTHNHHVVNSQFDYNSFADKLKIFTFSGKRGYLIWERNLDEWFHYNNILKEERLAYAIDQLRDDAFKWWVQEVDDRWFYKEPTIKTWRALKEVMRYEFVPKFTSSEIQELYPRRYPTHGSKEKSGKTTFQERAKVSPILDKFVYKSTSTGMSHLSLSKNVKTGLEDQKDTNSTPLLESRAVHELNPRNKEIPNQKKEEASSQGKSSNSKDLKDQTCYRCHKRGHYAVVCPTKQVLIETSLEKKTDLSMISDSFVQSDIVDPNSCIIHLSLSKGVVTGIKEDEKEPQGATLVMDQKMVQDTMQSMLLKEAKPVTKVSHQGSKNESYMLTDVTRLEPVHDFSHEPTPKLKPKIEQCVVQMPSLEVCFTLNQNFLIYSMIRLMHLSCPRECEIFLGTKEEYTAQTKETQTMKLQDAELMPLKVSISKVSVSNFKSSLIIDKADIMHLSLPKSFDPGIIKIEEHQNQDQKLQERQLCNTSCPKKKFTLQLVEAIKVSLELSHFVYNFSTTDIMHLLFVQNVEIISGCKEESFKEIPPDYLLLLGGSTPKKTRNVATNNLKDHPLQKRCNDHKHSIGVILSYLSKEEPPDAPCITKQKLYHQGKVLNSQMRIKPDLLYCGVSGYPVLRSKPLQGGGNDAAIKPVAEPEVHPTPYQTSQGANQDICALKMPYLANQEGFNHEANFYGFYTQDGAKTNWNHIQSCPEQKVMSFTKWRFAIPSIREYLTLEGDSNPKKERPEPKPIIGFKRSLSAFQKVQYQEKWPQNERVMIHSPKPAKPVLHMPQLGASRFNQLQIRHWRPGDHFNQSGGNPEVLSYTRTQENRRFNEESLKSNRSYLWKDWTIFRFDHFQAIPIRPEHIQTKPRRPGDIIGVQEEFHQFIPCTSPHWIRRILNYTKLPYLEILAFKLQQLFSLQIRHDFSTFKAIQKIPRKLSYPLKPSRFKETQILYLEPKSHKRLQRLVFQFIALSLISFLSFLYERLESCFSALYKLIVDIVKNHPQSPS